MNYDYSDGFDFGNAKVGGQKVKTLILANKGTKDIKITGSEIVGPDASMFKTGTKVLGNLQPGERINTNAINLYTPHPSLPLKGGGEGWGVMSFYLMRLY
jgi:hypothetical protein